MQNSILKIAGTIVTPKIPIIGRSLNETFSHAYTIPAESVTVPLYFGATVKLSESGAELDVELDESGIKLFDVPIKIGGTVTFDKTVDGYRFIGSATLAAAA